MFGRGKKADKEKASEAELERRDRHVVGSAAGNASRRRKDIMAEWKDMVKGQGKDWIERLLFLVAEDLKSGGVRVPTETDEVLDSTAAVIKMAEQSSQTVYDMASAQIAQYQASAQSSQEHLQSLDDQIRAAEQRVSEIRTEAARENVQIARSRKEYEDFLNQVAVAVEGKELKKTEPVCEDHPVPADPAEPVDLPEVPEVPKSTEPLPPYSKKY